MIEEYIKRNIISEEWYKVEQPIKSFWNDVMLTGTLNYDKLENIHDNLLYLQKITNAIIENDGLLDWFKEYVDCMYDAFTYLDMAFYKYNLVHDNTLTETAKKLMEDYQKYIKIVKEKTCR